MSNGYIYVASNNVGGVKGTNYIQEAIYSANSLRKYDPKANITLYTDKPIKNDVFTNIQIVKMSLRCKQKFLKNSPYEKTILIDTDTYINHSISDLFDLLDRYELLGVQDYARKRNFPNIPEYMNIPYGFSEINSGLLAFKKCENFTKMIDLWNFYYDKYKKVMPWDQPSFRIALWESDIKLYVLPIEYNRRGLHTKEKCVNLRKQGDKRFPKDHLKTRVFHFHGLEKMDINSKEKSAQYF
jgi:hypothetical protein